MKNYVCTYSAFNRDFKEYTGEIGLTAENQEQAYDRGLKAVRDKMGSDCIITLTILQKAVNRLLDISDLESAYLNLFQKLIEVRKVVAYLQKENTSTQYKYVSNSQVLQAVRGKMDELGLLLVPAVTGHAVRESTIEIPSEKNPNLAAKRTTTYFTELELNYTWINADVPSETLTTPWYAQGIDTAGEKGVGKAATYGEKYFLLKFFNIATDLDDPDHTNNQPAAPYVPPAAPAASKPATPPPATPAATQTPETPPGQPLVTESQLKMLNAKALAAGYKKEHKDDLMEAISIVLGRPIVSMNEVHKGEVDKIIKWFLEQTSSGSTP